MSGAALSEKKPLIIVTRPLPEARQSAEKIEQYGFETALHPLGELSYPDTDRQEDLFDKLHEPCPSQGGDFILTSLRAVPPVKKLGISKQARFYVVGERTKAALIKTGYTNVLIAAPDSTGLIAYLSEDGPKRAVYLKGRDVRRNLKNELAESGLSITPIEVYALDYERGPDAGLVSLLKSRCKKEQICILPVYSVRAAKTLALSIEKLSLKERRHIGFLALSEAVAQMFSRLEGLEGAISDAPYERSLIDKLRLMYDKNMC